MDWNWFFSSLAQSVAALVGVFSAFIITKIINNQSEFTRRVARTQELLDMSLKYKEAASLRYFVWFNERRVESAMNGLSDLLNTQQPILTVEEYYARLEFPEYVARAEMLEKIKELLPIKSEAASADDEWPDETEDNYRNQVTTRRFQMPIFPVDCDLQRLKIDQARRERDAVEREGEKIEGLYIDIRHHIRLVDQHIAAIQGNPESSSLIKFSIAAALLLFLSGVIAPLSFLPYAIEPQITFRAFLFTLVPVKILMLTIIALVFGALMVFFWRVNSSLTHDKTEVQKLRDAGKFGFYSTYFEIRMNNQIEHDEYLKIANAEN